MNINYYQSAHYLIVSLITSLVANKVVLISASSPSCLAHPPVLSAWPSICPGPVGKKLSLPKRCWWVGSILISYLDIFLCLTLYSGRGGERALHAVYGREPYKQYWGDEVLPPEFYSNYQVAWWQWRHSHAPILCCHSAHRWTFFCHTHCTTCHGLAALGHM